MDDLARQIIMLKLVPRITWATTPQIHKALAEEGFEVDIRTVQRDLMNIHERMLFPLEADLGSRPYKWRWPRDGFVDIPSMTTVQALSFVMADRYLREVFPPSLLEHLRPHVAHAEGVLGQTRNQQFGKWADKVAILPRQQALLPARVDAGVHDAIARALLTERQIEAVYQPRGREAREYQLNPQALVMRGSASYLVASANGYDDPIHFALHRFISAEVSTRPARSIPGFSLTRHIHEDRVFDYPLQDASIRLVALFDADRALHLHETPLSADQTLESMPDGRERLTATVRDTQELRWWLLGFGDGVEILEPAEMRAEFEATAAGLSKIYGARQPT
ncbi:MAG: WYL domain-containing protein [Halothiobacillaceae bacterium]|nr:WYL domain-containing protein [Halothiobacillaceae bacterium]